MGINSVSEKNLNNPSKFKFFIFIVISLVYLLLEVNLNLSLVELYSTSASQLLSNQSNLHEISRIEILGRFISGFGFTFIFFNSFYKLFFKKSYKLLKIFLFILMWVVISHGLRVVVDAFVYSASPEKKFSAVRAILFKEMFIYDLLEVENLPILTQFNDDIERKRIVSALIPTFSLLSQTIEKSVAKNANSLSMRLIEIESLKKYRLESEPKFKLVKKKADSSFDRFIPYQNQYNSQLENLKDPSYIKKQTDQEILSVRNLQEKLWMHYYNDISGINDFSKYLWANQDSTIIPYLLAARKKNCGKKCEWELYQKLKQKLPSLKLAPMDIDFWLEEGFFEQIFKYGVARIRVYTDTLDHVSCQLVNGKVKGMCNRPNTLGYGYSENELKKAHIEYLKRLYPFGLKLNQDKFNKLPSIRAQVVELLKKNNIVVDSDWSIFNRGIINKHFRQIIEQETKKLIVNYNSNNKIQLHPSIKINNRIDFYQQAKVQEMFKKELSEFYYTGFSPLDSEKISFGKWQKKQTTNSLNVMEIINARATDGFRAGGLFYELGNDAIKFTIVPSIAIALSVLSVLLILSKLLIMPFYMRYKTEKEKDNKAKKSRWLILFSISTLLVFSFPLMKGEFTAALGRFIETSETEKNTTEVAGWYGLGYILDAESSLTDIASMLQIDTNEIFQKDIISSLISFDDYIYQYSRLIPKIFFPDKAIENTNFNVVIYREQYDVILAMGIEMNEDKVERVALPNIMASKELDIILDAKVFFVPDYEELFQSALLDEIGPDFLISLGSRESFKISTRQQFERKLKKLLNKKHHKNGSIARILPTGVNKGNIVMFKLRKEGKYRCYYIESINLKSLPKLFLSRESGLSPYNCSWSI